MERVSLLLLFICLLTSNAKGASKSGNGGDLLYCKKSLSNPFKGYHSFDRVVTYSNNEKALVKVRSWEESKKRILKTLTEMERYAPGVRMISRDLRDFFRTIAKKGEENSVYSWEEAAWGIADLKDEDTLKLVPRNCRKDNEPNIHQYIVRDVTRSRQIVFLYDTGLQRKIFPHRPIDFSMQMIHEFFWNYFTGSKKIRKMNAYIHSSDFNVENTVKFLQLLGLEGLSTTSFTSMIHSQSSLLKMVQANKINLAKNIIDLGLTSPGFSFCKILQDSVLEREAEKLSDIDHLCLREMGDNGKALIEFYNKYNQFKESSIVSDRSFIELIKDSERYPILSGHQVAFRDELTKKIASMTISDELSSDFIFNEILISCEKKRSFVLSSLGIETKDFDVSRLSNPLSIFEKRLDKIIPCLKEKDRGMFLEGLKSELGRHRLFKEDFVKSESFLRSKMILEILAIKDGEKKRGEIRLIVQPWLKELREKIELGSFKVGDDSLYFFTSDGEFTKEGRSFTKNLEIIKSEKRYIELDLEKEFSLIHETLEWLKASKIVPEYFSIKITRMHKASFFKSNCSRAIMKAKRAIREVKQAKYPFHIINEVKALKTEVVRKGFSLYCVAFVRARVSFDAEYFK